MHQFFVSGRKEVFIFVLLPGNVLFSYSLSVASVMMNTFCCAWIVNMLHRQYANMHKQMAGNTCNDVYTMLWQRNCFHVGICCPVIKERKFSYCIMHFCTITSAFINSFIFQTIKHSACIGVDLLSCISRPPSQKKTAEKLNSASGHFFGNFRLYVAVAK